MQGMRPQWLTVDKSYRRIPGSVYRLVCGQGESDVESYWRSEVRSESWEVVFHHLLENGDVIFESDHVFDSQEEAERWLVKALRGLASEFPPEPQEGNPKPPKP
ncbi:hypothetical protein GCM10027214_01670 [Stenotrophomonas tumulicola]